MSYDRKMGKDRDKIYDLKQNIFKLDKAKRSAASKKGAMYKKGAVHKESEELATMPGSFKDMGDTAAVGKKMYGGSALPMNEGSALMKASWMSKHVNAGMKYDIKEASNMSLTAKARGRYARNAQAASKSGYKG